MPDLLLRLELWLARHDNHSVAIECITRNGERMFVVYAYMGLQHQARTTLAYADTPFLQDSLTQLLQKLGELPRVEP